MSESYYCDIPRSEWERMAPLALDVGRAPDGRPVLMFWGVHQGRQARAVDLRVPVVTTFTITGLLAEDDPPRRPRLAKARAA